MINPEKANFLIVGLVRDCEATLAKDISTLLKAFRFTQKLAWLIIESDSSDKTVSLLHKESEKISNFSYVTLGNKINTTPKRTQRIAACRNTYLHEIKTNPKYNDIDYIVVADLDGVNTIISEKAIRSCWKKTGWDACCANQKGPYYDIWALRHKNWSPNDCWQQQQHLEAQGVSRYTSTNISVIRRMITIPKNDDWIEVDSAFGGCAIYKKDSIPKVAQYIGLTHDGNEVCEHVEFNKQLKASGGRIFINPEFINAKVVNHARAATRIGRTITYLRSKAKIATHKIIAPKNQDQRHRK